MRILKKGMTGDDVRELQTALNRAGYRVTVDGVFGSGTYTAVKTFQMTHNLTADGIAGPATWAELDRVKPTNNEMYDAFVTCVEAIRALPEFKKLEEMLNG